VARRSERPPARVPLGAMARFWTCPRCKTRWSRTKQKCSCGRARPKARPAAHKAALDLSYERYAELNGGERCGICGAEGKTRRLHRDHDHRTGEPRGLLCFPCNAALRPYMTAEWLAKALAYVEKP
jgi:hypothetical protein